MGATGMGMPMGMPAGTSNMMMVPRCNMKFERCSGGMKIACHCDDRVTAGMLQNLCKMMANGMCSCCAMMNGMMTCCCNMSMARCACEDTSEGVTITCTSGDAKCCDMIQACCDCMVKMMAAGCVCCVMMNNMPICCSMM